MISTCTTRVYFMKFREELASILEILYKMVKTKFDEKVAIRWSDPFSKSETLIR